MTDDDVERLLRRTYREVAARTDEMTSATTMSEPIERPGAQRRRQPVLAAAATLVMVVAGLVVLTGRGGEAPATMGEPRHVVVGAVPLTESGRPLALAEIVSTESYDRLMWSADGASVSIEYDRTATELPVGSPSVVRDEAAVIADDAIAWFGPAGGVVTLTIRGETDVAALGDIERTLVYLDDETWSRLTATGGFLADDREPLLSWRIDAERPFEITLVGDLHRGLSISDDTQGWDLRYFSEFVDPVCRTGVNYGISDIEAEPERESSSTGYTIVDLLARNRVTAQAEGRRDRIVEMTSLRPTLDLSIGAIVYDDRPPGRPHPTCESSER